LVVRARPESAKRTLKTGALGQTLTRTTKRKARLKERKEEKVYTQ